MDLSYAAFDELLFFLGHPDSHLFAWQSTPYKCFTAICQRADGLAAAHDVFQG